MRDSLIVVGLVVAACVAMVACDPPKWVQEAEQERKAQEAANRVPRIVSRSADGCDVYAFNPGDRWRYFTRCGTQTTTDNSYTVTKQSGKTTTTVTVDDAITTERRP